MRRKGRSLRNIFARDTDDLPPVGDYTVTSPLNEEPVAEFAEMAIHGIANFSNLRSTISENEKLIAKVVFSSC